MSISIHMQNLDKFSKIVLTILIGNKILTDRWTDGMTDNPNPIYPPLFQSGTILKELVGYFPNFMIYKVKLWSDTCHRHSEGHTMMSALFICFGIMFKELNRLTSPIYLVWW